MPNLSEGIVVKCDKCGWKDGELEFIGYTVKNGELINLYTCPNCEEHEAISDDMP